MVNNKGIWDELNSISLEEHARMDRSSSKFLDHLKRHGKGLTADQYDDYAHYLSSYPALVIDPNGPEYEVYGYIAQDGRKYKFTKTGEKDIVLVIYVGDDVKGGAITYFPTDYDNNYFRINPFKLYKPDGGDDRRYKSDLDGKFEGLKNLKPILKGKNAITIEEYEGIKNKILRGEPL